MSCLFCCSSLVVIFDVCSLCVLVVPCSENCGSVVMFVIGR